MFCSNVFAVSSHPAAAAGLKMFTEASVQIYSLASNNCPHVHERKSSNVKMSVNNIQQLVIGANVPMDVRSLGLSSETVIHSLPSLIKMALCYSNTASSEPHLKTLAHYDALKVLNSFN